MSRVENGYKFERLLGEGAFGKVYAATRLADDAKVAIKNINFPLKVTWKPLF